MYWKLQVFHSSHLPLLPAITFSIEILINWTCILQVGAHLLLLVETLHSWINHVTHHRTTTLQYSIPLYGLACSVLELCPPGRAHHLSLVPLWLEGCWELPFLAALLNLSFTSETAWGSQSVSQRWATSALDCYYDVAWPFWGEETLVSIWLSIRVQGSASDIYRRSILKCIQILISIMTYSLIMQIILLIDNKKPKPKGWRGENTGNLHQAKHALQLFLKPSILRDNDWIFMRFICISKLALGMENLLRTGSAKQMHKNWKSAFHLSLNTNHCPERAMLSLLHITLPLVL